MSTDAAPEFDVDLVGPCKHVPLASGGVAGPVSRRIQRRAYGIYGLAWAAGAAILVAGPTAGWQAFGLGLWAPGAGFLAVGGWWSLLLIPTVVLFAVAVFAWFGAGMLAAPIGVWLGSALLASAIAGERIWSGGPIVALVGIVALGAYGHFRRAAGHKTGLASFEQKTGALKGAVEQALARAEPAPRRAERELTSADLKGLRYLLDRALQPIDQFGGFELIDIFQTASVRYQINLAGYFLSVTHAQYMPNFQGYIAEAQKNLIEKYLLRRVWIYWVLETLWGHFNFWNWDPAGKDNIMLTGYLGAQVSLYVGNTGDQRYSVPGGLTFRLGGPLKWRHDVHSVTKSVFDNMATSPLCLYPCEPNWVYPACNFKGMTTMVAHDRIFGTNFVSQTKDRFLEHLDREFTDASGAIIGLRSSLTGFAFPFPTGDAGFAVPCNTFDPDRAWRLWALSAAGLRKAIIEKDGKRVLGLPNEGIDFGNYRRGNLTLAMGSLLHTAGEFGDRELQEVIQNTLDVRCGKVEENSVISYRAGSNTANIYAVSGGWMRRDDFRRTFTEPRSQAAISGPCLLNAAYPDVLVARAFSDGDDLDLVLHPGRGTGPQSLGLGRLKPFGRYAVDGRPDLSFQADAAGTAGLSVELDGRTPLHIRLAA